jgi:hypothetical protein
VDQNPKQPAADSLEDIYITLEDRQKKAREIGERVYEGTKDKMSKTVPVNRWKVV